MLRGKIRAVLVCALLGATPTGAGIEIVRDPSAWDYAPLLYSDLVVRGSISSLSEADVSTADLWMDPPERRAKVPDMKRTMLFVSIDVAEVLRGPAVPSKQTFLVWDDLAEAKRAYRIGNEMIVCGYHHSILNTYYQTTPYGRYLREGDGWRTEETSRGRRLFADSELRAKISSMALSIVAGEADLIVQGVIQSVAKGTVYGPDSTSAELVSIDVRIEVVKKVRVDGDVVTVVALTRGLYLPAWRAHVPRDYAIGQRWLCFLKRNEFGWFPFAGTNGFLRVEQDGYVYDERTPYWLSKDRIESAITEASAGEGP